MIEARVYDVIVVGSGPGGLAAAIGARKAGAERVVIIERDQELGGILLQCIHHGFGTQIFDEELPGPTYAQRFINEARTLGVDVLLDTMVLDVTAKRDVTAVNTTEGLLGLQAGALVLAMGCRERTRPQIRLPGTRPAGVYTAGTAQRFVNVEGFMPGRRFVILGSGDIGMIMARRLTFEGAEVSQVLEIQPYLSGLNRNYVQCLLDFDIPLRLRHTVGRIIGDRRVEAVETVQVDEQWRPVPGSEEIVPCDTLLLSVGLIPENELSRQAGVKLDPVTGGPIVDEGFQTSVPGIFAAGNVVHVYDLVDWVTEAGLVAGREAARFAAGEPLPGDEAEVALVGGKNVRYVVPHTLHPSALQEGPVQLQMRVKQPIEHAVWLEVRDGQRLIRRERERYVRPGEMVTLTLRGTEAGAVAESRRLTVGVAEQTADSA